MTRQFYDGIRGHRRLSGYGDFSGGNGSRSSRSTLRGCQRRSCRQRCGNGTGSHEAGQPLRAAIAQTVRHRRARHSQLIVFLFHTATRSKRASRRSDQFACRRGG
jgi:hypothetical protein